MYAQILSAKCFFPCNLLHGVTMPLLNESDPESMYNLGRNLLLIKQKNKNKNKKNKQEEEIIA